MSEFDELDDLDDLLGDLNNPNPTSNNNTEQNYDNDDLDDLLQDLNMDAPNNNTNTRPQPQQVPQAHSVPQPTPVGGQRMTGISTGVPQMSNGGPQRISTGIDPNRSKMSTGVPKMSTGVPRMMTGPGRQTSGISTGVPKMSTGVPKMRTGVATGVPVKSKNVIATGVDPKLLNRGYGGRGKQMATHTPTGQRIKHRGPPCTVCNEQIYGKVLSVNRQPHHPECVRCSVCNRSVGGEKFAFKDDRIFCQKDYFETYAPKCATCGSLIKGTMITSKGERGTKKYHPPHFLCCGCGTTLNQQEFKADLDGSPFCIRCFGERIKIEEAPDHMCGMCKKKIIGPFIRLPSGLYIHPEHYTCHTCHKKLSGNDLVEFQGHLFCREDYLKQLHQICAACKKPIMGRSITALGKTWHPDHFVCAHCAEGCGDNFYVNKGKPYCEKHYHQLFGKMCEKCGQPVILDLIQDPESGKAWHKQHFCCTGCDANLSTSSKVVIHNAKPYCSRCFSKLPKHVRLEIKKRRAGRKKAEERKKKEEEALAKAKKKEAKKLAKEQKLIEQK